MSILSPEQQRRREEDIAEIARQKAMDAPKTRLQEEREQALAKKRELIKAYNRDALGSYNTAQKRAYENALPDGILGGGMGKRVDYQWIQKIRGIAETEFNNQNRKEKDELIQAYNLKKVPNGPIGSFTDMPVRIIDALGRDVGIMAANSRDRFSVQTNDNLFGSGSGFLPRSINVADKAVDTAGEYINAFKDDVTRIVTESPWIQKKLKSLKEKAKNPLSLKDVNSFMDKTNNVFSSGLRRFLGDFGEILNEWWHDPRTLCCFIKTVTALALATGKKIQGKGEFGSEYNKFIKKVMSGEQQISELTGTREFFDKMISILKIIRDFLGQELNFNFALNLDLGLAMSKASIGALMALLSALQQMLEDKIYSKMMEFVENNVGEEIRQCLPFEKLLRMLADWMSGPDGLFKYIESFVDAYMIGFQTNVQYGFDQASKVKMMDTAALDKLINLLEKLRDSMMNLELCIEADFNKTPELSDDGDITSKEKSVGIGRTNFNQLAGSVSGQGSVRYPTDTEVTAFLVNRLGESQEFANQVIASAHAGFDLNVGRAAGSPDNAGGDAAADLRMAIGDCARTLNSARIEELARLVADWEII
jgi:hypothetical protein